MREAVVFGGYGVFGSLVARELARLGVAVVVAGRDGGRADALARELGEPHRAAVADATDAASCRRALSGRGIAVSCAGPFREHDAALLDACLEEGCHYADIADDRAHCSLVRERGKRFEERGLSAVYGCSSLPALSGALALLAREGARSAPVKVRVTLFIGNRNRKGGAAVRSAVSAIGARIESPQGPLTGFRGREVVSLPAPFGERAVLDFDSPDYDLLPALTGAREVRVKVGFELRPATLAFAALARLSKGYGERTARWLERLSAIAPWRGCSGGAVVSELFLEDGSVARASISGAEDGQRMAALPCALAVAALLDGKAKAPGALTAYELLGARALLESVAAQGFVLARS